MLKVIIADDELHIRNLLKYLIHWEELGLTFAAEYDNGPDVVEHVERAYRYHHHGHPDARDGWIGYDSGRAGDRPQ